MTTTAPEQEIAAVEAIVAEAERLQYDADGYAALLTEDAAIVNFFGRRVAGREKIRTVMRQALASSLADVHTRHELVDVRFPAPGVALANCVKHVSDERDPADGDDELRSDRGNLTFTLVKHDGRWLIALAQTTPITD
jgi:uncharacterized protein (TIGR02246 family)